MTYAEKLAEFVKATGSKPGEMNRVPLDATGRPIADAIEQLAQAVRSTSYPKPDGDEEK